MIQVLARAREQIDALLWAVPALLDLRVLETRELIRIEIRQGERNLSVTLSKRGLEHVDVMRRDEAPGE